MKKSKSTSFKKIFISFLAVSCAISSFACISANAVGNIQNRYIYIKAINNDGGTTHRSSWEEKRDATSVWCENLSNSGGSLSAWVQRSNSTSAGSVNTVDRYYGSWSYNGATKNMKSLPKGTYYYLDNYVYEDGYSYAALGYIMSREHVDYHIEWSPDSI